MYILNIVNALKEISVNEIRDFNFEDYCKRIGFSKENSYYSMKHQKKKDVQLFAIVCKLTQKIPDLCNAKEHYQSFIRKKNTKSGKQLKVITQ